MINVKKSKVFLGIALIFLMVSGCGAKLEPSPDNAIPQGEAASKEDAAMKSRTAGTPITTVLDEKSHSLHSGELFAKKR